MNDASPRRVPSRRSVLGYMAAGAGTAAAASGAFAFNSSVETAGSASTPEVTRTRQSYSPHGLHQAGIVTPAPAATKLIGFDLLSDTDVEALSRLMRLWSSDIANMMAGEPIPGDTAPELAQANTSLSITVGFGPGVFDLEGLAQQRPAGFVTIPAMQHDRLADEWSGGDLLAIVAADDRTTIDYVSRRLIRDAETFATPRWVQTGSWRGLDANGDPVTGRNLFGQKDGTANPGGDVLDESVWIDGGPQWLTGGTTVVIRRIEMDLDDWDDLGRSSQEKVIGRNLDDGAPLTGDREYDAPDFTATDGGELVIPEDAHIRLAHPVNNAGRRILRRGINYTHEERSGSRTVTSAGLLFLSFQANVAEQFVPIQRTLDNSDALNRWTTAIGSAVFAIPGGFDEQGWVGRQLLS